MPSPYYPFMSLTGRGHDTFVCRITCKNARIWTFFWLDRKQYEWFALFRLAKMPPSVSCCWFQSAFLLAKWAVNTHATWLWNFYRLSFLEFEECLNRNFIHWNIFHLIVYTDHLNAIWYPLQVTEATNGFTFLIMNSWMESWPGLTVIPPSVETCELFCDLRFHDTFQFVKYGASAYFFHCFWYRTKSTSVNQ